MYIFLLLLFCSNIRCERAITYEFNGGRFGDCLSTYSKAKWFAHKHKLKLIYKPFTYSDQLAMHTIESLYTNDVIQSFDKIVKVKSEADILAHTDKHILFISNFYSQTPGLYEYGIQNEQFGQEIRKVLTPIIPLPSIEKPNDSISAAVHVRKGGGFDKPLASEQIYKKAEQYADQTWPTKFPPDQYYIDQIQILKKIVGIDIKLIIYLLTDDPDPASVAARYAEKLNDPLIHFVFRSHNNSHDTNVVEDFYIMAQCDCLIRSSSLFAKAAQLLGNHQIIIYPISGKWADGKVIIDPVGITMRS
jgi:hypothetical protein